MRRPFILYFLLAALLAVSSCEEERIEVGPEQALKGSEYFPLKVGRYLEYQVRKITHRELIADDTADYFIRQVITSVSLEGRDSIFRIERFRKEELQAPWTPDSVWTARRDERRLVQVENNEPFVKLVLPLEIPLTWDGNAYNIRPQEDYRLIALDTAYSINDFDFERSAKVLHRDSYTLIDKDFRQEIYVAEIGLVHSKQETYQYINDSQSSFYARDSIVGGVFYEEVLVGYGEL